MSTTTASQPQDARLPRDQTKFASNDLRLRQDVVEYVREYARQHPGAVALWCLGIGFVLGWKLKPW